MTTRFRFQLALLSVDLMLLAQAVRPSWSQDFLPWYTAATLVQSGQIDSVYLSADAPHLFASDPVFIEASLDAAGEGVPPNQITAFVAPPASLLPVIPLTSLAYDAAATVWRLVLATLAIASLHRLAARRPRLGAVDDAVWIAGVLLFVPVLSYALRVGQPSMLLLCVAALFSPTDSSGRGRWLLAAALAAAIAYKVIPILLLGFLVLMGRRRVVASTAAIGLVWSALSMLLLPIELLPSFLASLKGIGGGVITDWNNASIDALLLRGLTGDATPVFVAAPLWLQIAAGTVKGAVMVVAIAIAGGWVRAHADRRWAAGWVATLSLSPLLWAHYLVVAPALLPTPGRGPGIVRLVLLSSAGAWILLAAAGVFSTWALGMLGGTIWISIASAVLLGVGSEGGSETGNPHPVGIPEPHGKPGGGSAAYPHLWRTLWKP